jgi:hypothetical protein
VEVQYRPKRTSGDTLFEVLTAAYQEWCNQIMLDLQEPLHLWGFELASTACEENDFGTLPVVFGATFADSAKRELEIYLTLGAHWDVSVLIEADDLTICRTTYRDDKNVRSVVRHLTHLIERALRGAAEAG